MEDTSDQLSPQPDYIWFPNNELRLPQRRPGSKFLSFCDRVSTGHDIGYYWEDVQRALRIAAGLENWPD